MMGSAVVSLPWGIFQSGLFTGLFILIFVGGISLYTCSLVIKHGSDVSDYSEMVEQHLGRPAAAVVSIVSVVSVVVVLVMGP